MNKNVNPWSKYCPWPWAILMQRSVNPGQLVQAV